MPEPVRLICREAGLDALLAKMAVHGLDLVLADRPIPPVVSTGGSSDKLSVCAAGFFAIEKLARKLKGVFLDACMVRRYRFPAAVLSCLPAFTGGWTSIAFIRV